MFSQHLFLFRYKKDNFGKTFIEVKSMKNFKRKIKSLSQETKVGITIFVVAILFFTTVGLARNWWKNDESPSTKPSNSTTSNVVPSSPTPSSPTPTTSTNVNVNLEEKVGYPYSGNKEIARHFYDLDSSVELQAESIIYYDGKYYASKGIDIVSVDGKSFDVVAALSGEVESVKNDPMYGLTVIIENEYDIKTIYSSLESTTLKEGDKVSKGDVIGLAGESLFGSDLNKIHVTFQMMKDDLYLNPEKCFGKKVSNI